MENILKFVEDAIKGGYKIVNLRLNGSILYENTLSSKGDTFLSELLLDPKFWKAVGKTRKWEKSMLRDYPSSIDDLPVFADDFIDDEEWSIPEWHYNMLYFVEKRIEGKSVDEILGMYG